MFNAAIYPCYKALRYPSSEMYPERSKTYDNYNLKERKKKKRKLLKYFTKDKIWSAS